MPPSDLVENPAGPGAASPERIPVSVVILTHNAERIVEPCLQSVAAWAAEIFVVDSGSTDGTESLVLRYTDKLIRHRFENYTEQRNWAQAHLPLRNDWVLHLDADERVSPELARAIGTFFESPRRHVINGLLICRRTVFMGRWMKHGGHYPRWHLRLFRRDKGKCEDRAYDQHFLVEGPVDRLSGDLIDVLAPDVATWLNRHARWAQLEAQAILAQDARGSPRESGHRVTGRLAGSPIERRRWLRDSLYGRAPLLARAGGLFIYRYVIRLGFLDGVEGLIFHFLQGCWFRFYVDALVYEARRRGR